MPCLRDVCSVLSWCTVEFGLLCEDRGCNTTASSATHHSGPYQFILVSVVGLRLMHCSWDGSPTECYILKNFSTEQSPEKSAVTAAP